MTAELIAIEGPLQGVILALDQGKEWLLGRDPQSCQLVVEDPKVDRQACRIVLTDDGYSIKNLGKNPILINGRELSQAPINDGDVLKIGDSTFSFYTIEEFQEIVFGGERELPADEELIASEEGLTQNFQREGGGAEYSEENLPDEEPAEEFVGEKPKKKKGAKEQEFKMEPAGRKQSEPKGPKEEDFKKERAAKAGKPPKQAKEEEFAREQGKDREPEAELGPEEEALAGEIEKGERQGKPTGPKEETFAGGAEKTPKKQKPQGPKEEIFAGGAEKEKAEQKPTGPEEEAFAGEADREQLVAGLSGPTEEAFSGEADREQAAKRSGPKEETFAGEADKEAPAAKPTGPSEEAFSGEAEKRPPQKAGPKEEAFAGEADREPTFMGPTGPAEETFAGGTEKERGHKGPTGPAEETFAGEAEKEKASKGAAGPSEEGFAGEAEKEKASKGAAGPSEEGFAGEAERERAAAKESGPTEEPFAGETERERASKGTTGPSEETFAGETEKAKASPRPTGPGEEGFAGAGVDKEKKGAQGPQEEGFAREGRDMASADDWESEEGEAADFEEDELAEEAAVNKKEPSHGEELVSEGSEKERPRSKDKSSEELVSEGRDRKEKFHEKPGEELAAEGVDRERAFTEKPGEELVAEGADKEESFVQRPGEELVSEGAESRPPEAPMEEMASEGADREKAGEREKPSEELVYENLDFGDAPLKQEPPGEQLSGEGNESVIPPPPPSEEFEKESLSEGDLEEEPLFSPEDETEGVVVDLTPSVRFLLKVIAGPNTGAEFALDMGRNYLIGTEASSCDIVFHDLSVSREHARLFLSAKGELEIEDLGSRNGILIDQEQISGRVPFNPNVVVSLGTTGFFIVDREAPQETLVAPVFEPPRRQPDEEKEEVPVDETEEEPVEEPAVALKDETKEKAPAKPGFSIYVSIVCGLAILLGISMVSLFQTKELQAPPKDFVAEIKHAVKDFPSVKYTYSPNTSRLFLVGHVATGIEKDELFYNLNALSFLKGIDDHVVNDEAIWQEMNILLSKQNDFKGVSMHSPRPAVFVLNGYLKTEKQAADLTDWVNTHFNYISLLENRVVVEEAVIEEVSSQLLHNGFGAVAVTFTNGELTLAGYVGSAQAYEFERLVHGFGQLPGIRNVQNFVVIVAPEQQVIDLNQRYPGRFKVTGYSKHGDVSINVVINGRILMRGDQLDGMTLTSIQPHAVFFEKDGLKYKLEYNK